MYDTLITMCYLLLSLFRLMQTTNAGHLFKSGSQEHQSKS
jgi:hypothetical protein